MLRKVGLGTIILLLQLMSWCCTSGDLNPNSAPPAKALISDFDQSCDVTAWLVVGGLCCF